MNICITEASSKNFMGLFNTIIPSVLSNSNMSAKDVLKELYDKTLEVLQDDSGVDTLRLKEVIIQHLGIGVAMINKEIGNNPLLQGNAYVNDFSEIGSNISNSLNGKDFDFQKIFNYLGSILEKGKQVVTERENIRFNAVSLEWARTTVQLSILGQKIGYKANVTSEEKKYHEEVIKAILEDTSNPLEFKLVKGSDVLDNDNYAVVSSISKGDFVLIPTAQNLDFVFKGKTPVFTFKQFEKELQETKKAKIESEFRISRRISPNTTIEEIKTSIDKSLKDYLAIIEEAKENYESGENVFFKINYEGSSKGFVEFNRNTVTNSHEIPNINSSNVVEDFKEITRLVLNVGSNNPITLFERGWISQTDEQFEMLLHLIQTEKPTLISEDSGKLWSEKNAKAEVAKELRRFFPTGKSRPHAKIDMVKKEVTLFDRVIKFEDLTLEDLKAAAKNRSLDIAVPQSEIAKQSNVEILNSESEVTELGQWYKDSNGVVKEAIGIRKGYGSHTTKIRTAVNKLIGLVDGKVIVSAKMPFTQTVLEDSYINAQLNAQGELKGASQYLSFFPVAELKASAADPDFFNGDFQKVSNQGKVATEKTIRDLSEKLSERIGIPVEVINNPSERYKGKLSKGIAYVNLAYATLDTPVHEILGHPLIKAIKQDKKELYDRLLKELDYGLGKDILDRIKKDYSFEGVTESIALEEQKEEALVELLGLMVADKLDEVKHGKLITLLKKILNEMSKVLKSLINKKEIIVSELPENLTVRDLASVLAYSKGKIVLSKNNISENDVFQKIASTEGQLSLFKKGDVTLSAQEIGLFIESVNSMTSFILADSFSSHTTQKKINLSLVVLHKMMALDVNSAEYTSLQADLDNLKSSLPTGLNYESFRDVKNLRAVTAFIKGTFKAKLATLTKESKTDTDNPFLENQIEFLEKISQDELFGNPNKIEEYLNEKTPSTLLSLFLKNNPFYLLSKETISEKIERRNKTEEEREQESTDESGEEVFQIGADQYNSTIHELDALEEQTKFILSSIPMHSMNGIGNVMVNSLGFPQLRTLQEMNFKVMTALMQSTDAIEMNAKLKSMARGEGKIAGDKEIAHIYKLLGDINSPNANQELWNDFVQSFNKYYNKSISVIATITNEYESVDTDQYTDDGVMIKQNKLKSTNTSMHSGQIGQDIQFIKKQWQTAFEYLLENESPYVEIDENGNKYFDLSYLLKDFTESADYRHMPPNYSGNQQGVFSDLSGVPNRANYTSKVPKAVWAAFEFFKEMGIDIVNDPRIAQAFIYGDPNVKVDQGTPRWLLNHLLNRKTKILNSREAGGSSKRVIDTKALRIYNFNDFFSKFTFQNERGELEVSNQENALTNLMKLHYNYSNESGTFMAYNAEGNKTNQMSYHSSLNNMVSVINSAKSYSELIAIPGFEHFDIENNVQAQAYSWLNVMFNLQDSTSELYGVRNNKISIDVKNISGSKIIEEDVYENGVVNSNSAGVSVRNSDATTKFLSEILLTLDGVQETPRAEAKSTSLTVSGYLYKRSSSQVRGGNDLALNFSEAHELMQDDYSGKHMTDLFMDTLALELLRFNEIDNINIEDGLLFDAAYLNRGKNFQFFDDILSPKLKTKMRNLKVASVKELEAIFEKDVKLQQEFEKSLKKFFLDKLDILENNKLEVAFPKSLVDKASLNIPKEENHVTTSRLLLTYLINNTVNNLNYSNMFLLDFSNYNVLGEAFHKRIAGLISTGKGFRFDSVWLNHIKEDAFLTAKEYMKKSGKEIDQSFLNYDGYIRTGVMKEKTTISKYAEYYKDYLGIDTAKYDEMDEADGQGWISFDMYRILSRSTNEWSDAQENLYQKIAKGEMLNENDVKTTFPVRKFQMYGPLNGGSENVKLSVMGFHKYSLAPLVPTLIEGKPLGKLHEKMMEQGLGYVTMKSGSKLGNITPVALENGEYVSQYDNFYNDERQVDDELVFTPNVIHVRYLKNQLHLAEGYKGYISVPTQITKIALVGLFDQKVPTDYLTEEVRSENVVQQKNYNESLYRGQEAKPVIDKEGNLILVSTEDSLFKSKGISFAEDFNMAKDYGLRYSKNPYIIEIDVAYADKIFPLDLNGGTKSYGKRVVGDELEQRFISKENIVIPKGSYTIHSDTSNFNLDFLSGEDLIKEYNNQENEDDVAEASRYSEVSKGYATKGELYYEAIKNELIRRGLVEKDLLFLNINSDREEMNLIVANAYDIKYDHKSFSYPVSDEQIEKYLAKRNILLEKLNSSIKKSVNRKESWEALSELEKRAQSKHYDWYVRYNEVFNVKMPKMVKEELLNDLGMTYNPNTRLYDGDGSKLIKYIKANLLDKDLIDEEIMSIVDPATGNLIKDLSFSLHAAAIEKLLMVLVDKRLRKMKINGEALTQVSGAMQELLAIEGVEEVVNKDGDIKYGSNQLRFYHAVDKDGNPVDSKNKKDAVKVSTMEVMISLQGSYKHLLKLKHKDGKRIEVSNEEGLMYEDSLTRLNEMMDDEAFRKENADILTFAGIRIPTQSENSLSIPTVRRFLSEYAGPVIILPSEIVAQSGSDFDIDKLYAMMKSLAFIGGKVEVVKHRPEVTQTKAELKAERIAYSEEIKKLNEEIKSIEESKKPLLGERQSIVDEITLAVQKELGIDTDIKEFREEILKDIEHAERGVNKFRDFSDEEWEDALNFLDSQLAIADAIIKQQEEAVKEKMLEVLGAEYITDLYRVKDSLIAVANSKIEKIKELKDDNIRKINGLSIKGLQNDFVDLLIERGSMLSRFKGLVTANDTVDSKGMADEIAKRREDVPLDGEYNKHKKFESTVKGISPTEVMMPEHNLHKHQENFVGMDALGIAAVVSTFQAMFSLTEGSLQQNDAKTDADFAKAKKIINAYLEASSEEKLKYNMASVKDSEEVIKSYISKSVLLNANINKEGLNYFGGTTSSDGKDISDLISQMINGFVDVAADAWVFLIEGNKENTPVLLTMIMLGVPFKDAVRMSVHPLVRKYTSYKKMLTGPYANLGSPVAISKDGGIKARALASMDFFKNGTDLKNFQYNEINNLNTQPFTEAELKTLSEKQLDDINERDIELFAQYLHIEKISDEMTTVTNITKFDTTKMSTVNDVTKRIEDTKEYRNRPADGKFFGNKFIDYMQKEAIVSSKYNDDLIAHLFDKQFGARNNEVLTQMSLAIKQKDIPRGMDIANVRTHFKNDFFWFLYQNSVYSGDSVNINTSLGDGKVYEYKKRESALIEEEGNVVYYNPETSFSESMKAEEYKSVRKYFMDSVSPNVNQIKIFIAFKLTYEKLLSENKDLSMDEFNDKFFLFDRSGSTLRDNFSTGETGDASFRKAILQRAALFLSKNPNSMFDSDTGVIGIMTNLKARFPELNYYSLISDMRFDSRKLSKESSLDKKYNVFYPNLNADPNVLKRYKENLSDLSNHKNEWVKLIFDKHNFTHMALMQTGQSRNVKNDFVRIGHPEHLQEELLNSDVYSKINNTLKQAEVNYKENLSGKNKEAKSYLVLSQYFDMFSSVLKSGQYHSRYSGVNYIVSELDFVSTVNESIGALDVKATFVPANQATYTKQSFIENIDTLEDYIKDLATKGASFILLPDVKIEMNNEEDQSLLDSLLNKYLNVDNTGKNPKLIKRTGASKVESGLDIGPFLDKIKTEKSQKKYSVMAANATKMVGVKTEFLTSSYRSAVAELIDAINEDTAMKENLNPKELSGKDVVWLFGDISIIASSYSGYTKAEHTERINSEFEKNKPVLDNLISSKATVLLTPLEGFDSKASDYLQENDYIKSTVYKDGVKFFQFVHETKSTYKTTSKLDLASPIGNLAASLRKDLSEQFKALDKDKQISFLRQEFVKKVNSDPRLIMGRKFSIEVRSELLRIGDSVEIGLGDFNEAFEQMILAYSKDLKALQKENDNEFNSFSKSFFDVESKSITFDKLEEFTSKDRATVVANFMERHPDKYKSEEELIQKINEALKKDFKRTFSTLVELKNC